MLSIDHSSAVMHTDNSLHFNNHTDCMLDELHRDDVITVEVHTRVSPSCQLKSAQCGMFLANAPLDPPIGASALGLYV